MAATDRYRTPADLPERIAVFPLRGCILLPRATLPLNVFEPRYLQMVDDAIRSDRIIGIIQPSAAGGERESPSGKAVPLQKVGCAGRITGFEETPDGRMGIVLTGIARFDVAGEVETALPYRSVTASYARFAGDLTPGEGDDGIDRDTLIAALKTYLEAKRLQADWSVIERSSNEILINGLSIASPYAPEEKQALLEAATLKDRADVLMTLARMELAAGPDGDTRRRLQ